MVLAAPRRQVFAVFRLETDMITLQDIYLDLTYFRPPNCVLCRKCTVIDASHLKECPEVAGHLYSRYWQARQKLQDLRTG
ncbi:hypothetical protein CEXT_293101 [Caerostris extrusa]|uniref:Uncharacterized protein n=1 Tax=Caerostris extrusa TaxID=172846 RepID=A0AAV4WKY6_CAEEX|nr:hypothetical protein CEXT_293101 [Caerostris extrusa]